MLFRNIHSQWIVFLICKIVGYSCIYLLWFDKNCIKLDIMALHSSMLVYLCRNCIEAMNCAAGMYTLTMNNHNHHTTYKNSKQVVDTCSLLP